MVELKSAFEIMGLKEGADKGEIERRYNVLQKKYRAGIFDNSIKGSTEINIDEINHAYNLLMGYEADYYGSDVIVKPNLILKKIGVDEKKFKNFLHYYKFHIIGAVVIIVILVSMIRGGVNNAINTAAIDLNLAFIGKIACSDTDTLKQKITAALPELEVVSTDSVVIYEGMDAQLEYASNTKAAILFAVADVDVLIIDREVFKRYSGQGTFVSLDGIAANLDIDREKNKDYILKNEEGKETHFYGIDVTSNPIFKESGIIGENMIVAIKASCKHYDNAIKLVELLAK